MTSLLIGVTPPTASRIIKQGLVKSMTDSKHAFVAHEEADLYLKANNITAVPKDHSRHGEQSHDLVALSFFSGALGLDLGMELAGIPALCFCEFDRKCRMTIESNRPGAGLLGDITTLDAEAVKAAAGIEPNQGVDVMFGGPPCQAFSTAGARRAFADDRGNVFLEYLELASELRPCYLVIENVRGLLSAAWPLKKGGKPVKGGAMHLVLSKLAAMGYGVSFELYNAANFGAPQIRERVVLIAKRDGSKAPYLMPSHSNDSRFGLKPWVTFGEACRNLPKPLHHVEFPKDRAKYLDMLGPGEYWKDLPEGMQAAAMGKSYGLSGGKTGFYRRISFEEPCPTLVTSPTMPATYLCHPTETRPLSVEEYRRIQGFPDDWIICGSVADQYKQIGNAVPVALGRAIGETLLEDMSGHVRPRPERFPYSRYRMTNDLTWKPKS